MFVRWQEFETVRIDSGKIFHGIIYHTISNATNTLFISFPVIFTLLTFLACACETANKATRTICTFYVPVKLFDKNVTGLLLLYLSVLVLVFLSKTK